MSWSDYMHRNMKDVDVELVPMYNDIFGNKNC